MSDVEATGEQWDAEEQAAQVGIPAVIEGPPKRGTLSAALEDLDALGERIDKVVARTRASVDRINGGRARADMVDLKGDSRLNVMPPRDSILNSMRLKKERIGRALDALERELAALEDCI